MRCMHCFQAEISLSFPVRALDVTSAVLPTRPEMSSRDCIRLSWLCYRPPAYASCTRLKRSFAQHICWLCPGVATIWSKHGQPLGLACREAANGTASCRALQAPCPRHASRLYLGYQCARSTMHNSLRLALCCPCGGTTLTASMQCTLGSCK